VGQRLDRGRPPVPRDRDVEPLGGQADPVAARLLERGQFVRFRHVDHDLDRPAIAGPRRPEERGRLLPLSPSLGLQPLLVPALGVPVWAEQEAASLAVDERLAMTAA